MVSGVKEKAREGGRDCRGTELTACGGGGLVIIFGMDNNTRWNMNRRVLSDILLLSFQQHRAI